MKLSYPYLSEVFIIENQAVNTLVVESQKFFREILLDIKSQTRDATVIRFYPMKE